MPRMQRKKHPKRLEELPDAARRASRPRHGAHKTLQGDPPHENRQTYNLEGPVHNPSRTPQSRFRHCHPDSGGGLGVLQREAVLEARVGEKVDERQGGET